MTNLKHLISSILILTRERYTADLTKAVRQDWDSVYRGTPEDSEAFAGDIGDTPRRGLNRRAKEL